VEIVGGTITGGAISGGTITGGAISGGTITGSTIKTAASGIRIELAADDATLYIYDSGNDQVFLLDDSGVSIGLVTGDGRDLILASDDDGLLIADDILVVEAGSTLFLTAASTAFVDASFDMDQNDIYDVDDLDVTGTKNFLIPHPDGSNRLLRYVCVESPEVAVSYRGMLKLTSAVEFVPVPKHFELVTEPEGLVTVQLTPVGDAKVYIMEKPTNRGFTVSGEVGTTIMFEICAIRKGFLDLDVEIDLENPKSEKAAKIVKRRFEKEETIKRIEEKKIARTEMLRKLEEEGKSIS